MDRLKYKARNAFAAGFWAAFWLLLIALLWCWLVVLPGVGIAALAGLSC